MESFNLEPKKEKTAEEGEYYERFSGVLGQYYNLRSLAMPYFEQFEDTVKTALAQYSAEHPELSEIKVLEVGTGTGLTTIRVLDADPKIKLTTVDADGDLMQKAKEALQDMAERIEYINQDILSVLQEMEDGSLDAMASALTLHNFPIEYRMQMMKELSRVLKSGALFVNADKYAFDDQEAHERSLQEQIDSFEMFDKMDIPEVDIPALKKGWVDHYYEDEKTKFTEGEEVELLGELGFKEIKVIFRESMEAVITAIKG